MHYNISMENGKLEIIPIAIASSGFKVVESKGRPVDESTFLEQNVIAKVNIPNASTGSERK